MTRLAKTLEIRTSPHVLRGYSVDTIMFNVALALLLRLAFVAVASIAITIHACVTLRMAELAALAALGIRKSRLGHG